MTRPTSVSHPQAKAYPSWRWADRQNMPKGGPPFSSNAPSASTIPGRRLSPQSQRLGVYQTEKERPAVEVSHPPGLKRYWSRRALGGWLTELLAEAVPTLAGLHHAFSFPKRYSERPTLPCNRGAFLDDFQDHWPTDAPSLYADFLRHLRDAPAVHAARRTGDTRWPRRAEELTLLHELGVNEPKTMSKLAGCPVIG